MIAELEKPLDQSQEKTRQEILLASKYEAVGIDRFSPSSLSAFRTNRMRWALRYALEFKSMYPAPAMYRGNAIERAIKEELGDLPDGLERAIRYLQFDVAKSILRLYPNLPEGWEVNLIASKLSLFDRDKFIGTISDVFELLPKINPTLPKWIDSEFPSKIIKKIGKQYMIIDETYPESLEYFRSLGLLVYQHKIERDEIFGLPIKFVGYADFVSKVNHIGYDLKTREKKKDITLEEKCQMSAYADLTGLDWVVVMVNPLSATAKKETEIIAMAKSGLGSKEIAKSWKDSQGKGTTEKYVLELIEKANLGKIGKVEKLNTYKLSKSEVETYNQWNRATAEAINFVIKNSRKASLIEDLKKQCIANPEDMFLDPHEKEKIREIWGLDVEGEDEDC